MKRQIGNIIHPNVAQSLVRAKKEALNSLKYNNFT